MFCLYKGSNKGQVRAASHPLQESGKDNLHPWALFSFWVFVSFYWSTRNGEIGSVYIFETDLKLTM